MPAVRLPVRLPVRRTLLALGLVLTSAVALHAQPARAGSVATTWAQHCAACHGDQMEGGLGSSLLDDTWVAGSDDDGIARSIRDGIEEQGMPPFGGTLSEEQIRALVIHIREQRQRHAEGAITFNRPADAMTARTALHDFQLHTWIDGVNEPWSLAFLPEGRALVTEKGGRLLLVENGRLSPRPIRDVPRVDSRGQAGLFDVVPHPDHARNGWLYFAFAEPRTDDGARGSLTRIIRARLRDGALVDQENIFQAPAQFYRGTGGVHYGGRIAFGHDGMLYFVIGERGHGPNAQNLAAPTGKVHRLHDDGRVPADNPFVDRSDAMPTIWSWGHRNPQGLAVHPVTGALYDLEHGPRGGDELNLVQKGLNYGWPVITYGMNYDGTPITGLTHKEGMEQPIVHWVPSLAVCGMSFYTGDLFPRWRNHLFISSLAAEELRRLELHADGTVTQEVIFKGLGRIRHVIGGPDGALYVLLPGRIARLTPDS